MSNYSGFTEPVFVVDDEEDLRNIASDIVQGLGLVSRSTGNPQEALEWMKAGNGPCLILSDFRMPEMDGAQFCTAAKKLRPDIPFVLITGFLDKEVAVSGLKNGVNDVLEKPYRKEDLEGIIRKHVDARQTRIEEDAKELESITVLFVEESSALLSNLENLILRLEDDPPDAAIVDVLLRNVHSVKGSAGVIPGGKWLAELGHAFESCLVLVRNGKLKSDATAIEVFLLASDLSKKLLGLIQYKKDPSEELLQAVKLCVQSLDAVKSRDQSAPAKIPDAFIPPVGAAEKPEVAGESEGVWVSNQKLDSFMKVSGELIVLKNYFQVLHQDLSSLELSNRVSRKITDFSYSLDKITDNLQEQIMSVRKVTLERALSKVPRLFRQVTQELNKKIKLTTEGFELGVDRTIAHALSICLTHMLRNAIDHGIEPAEQRKAAGKSAEGQIRISAKERKGVIFFSISDDGGGIDAAKVLAKGVEKGLVESSRAASLNQEEIYDLLFLPGFSTAEKVTAISGRGVGMDAVKSEIVALGGKIQTESTLKKGTTFHLEIPVPRTVMVEQTILVKTSEALIAVPLNAIAQLTSCASLSISGVGHQKTCQFRGRTVPLRSCAEFMGSAPSEPVPTDPVVILQHKDSFMGFLVKSIHDQLEAVIRPFDKITQSFPGFKGTTVLGDDTIAYVLSPEEFVSLGLGLKRAVAA